MTNKIYLGDCLELMKHIPINSIDMILCDLPYGTTNNHWDIKIDFHLLWEQYKKIIKDNGAILLFAQSPFDKELAMSNIKLFRYEWIWEKSLATGFLNASKMPLKAHENILVFYKNLPTYNPIKAKGQMKVVAAEHQTKCQASSNYGKQIFTKDYCSDERYPRSVLRFQSVTKTSNVHPTQKPLPLIRYLIKTYTNENDLVLDNCMGNGTTITGCIQTKRNYIGIEKDEEIYKMAEKNINKALGKVGLFI